MYSVMHQLPVVVGASFARDPYPVVVGASFARDPYPVVVGASFARDPYPLLDIWLLFTKLQNLPTALYSAFLTRRKQPFRLLPLL